MALLDANRSLWLSTTTATAYGRLSGDHHADAVVVGVASPG